jgi:glycosyltransferase domain-containing protein
MVPTMNRSGFLIRLLRYFHEQGFKGWILIGDSSNPEEAGLSRAVIESLKSDLHILYLECPELNAIKTVEKLVAMVQTPYVAYIGDDDFLVPAGMEKCIEFLDQNPDYGAAHGYARGFKLKTRSRKAKMVTTGVYPQRAIEKETASERLMELLIDYSVMIFSVHRTEIWKIMWKDLNRIEDVSFAAEILPCCLSVVSGKVKSLNCLYLLRQSHNQIYQLPGFYDWITAPSWNPSYQIFLKSVAEQIAVKDGIFLSEAELAVRKAFHYYLFPVRQSRWGRLRIDLIVHFAPQIKQRAPWLMPVLKSSYYSVIYFIGISRRIVNTVTFQIEKILHDVLIAPSIYKKDMKQVSKAVEKQKKFYL